MKSQAPVSPHRSARSGVLDVEEHGAQRESRAEGQPHPCPIVGVRRKKDAEAQKDITKQDERVLLGFCNAYVFDVSQSDGADLPEMREVSGDPGENLDCHKRCLHRCP